MPVRNARLAAGSIATANSLITVYTVPANNAAIIKWVAVENYSASAITGQITILAPGAAEVDLARGSVAANTTLTWSGWTVLNAGDQVLISSSVTGIYYCVAGAQLPYATP